MSAMSAVHEPGRGLDGSGVFVVPDVNEGAFGARGGDGVQTDVQPVTDDGRLTNASGCQILWMHASTTLAAPLNRVDTPLSQSLTLLAVDDQSSNHPSGA